MKKRLLLLLSILIISTSFLAAQQYPPKGWNADFADAVEQAAEEDKYLLLNFTGSDWCVWCHRLSDEVFNTSEFDQWVKENAVLVFLDFPSSIDLSDAQRTQNGYLQQFLGVQGYPSIWLLDSDLTPLLVTGYQEGGADSYINHLENDRLNIEAAKEEEFKNQMSGFIKDYIEPLNL